MDRNGKGLAQPDAFILFEAEGEPWILLIEIKLTQTDYAFAQMGQLYGPLLKFLYPERKICQLQICKTLRYPPPNQIEDLFELLVRPREGQFLLHRLD